MRKYMKIQKDIRKDILTPQDCTTKSIPCENEHVKQSEYDMQQAVDDIFTAADAKIAKRAARSLPKFDKLKKIKLKASWSVIGFILFIIIGIGVMGYKTYKYAANRWPGIREELIRTYEDLQIKILDVDDSELTMEAYYQKQYMLVLDATDLRDLSQLTSNLEYIQELQKMVNNDETVSISLFEILPTDKAIKFITIMIAEQKAKASGEIVYVETITDEEIQQFLADIQEQQNQQDTGS